MQKETHLSGRESPHCSHRPDRSIDEGAATDVECTIGATTGDRRSCVVAFTFAVDAYNANV